MPTPFRNRAEAGQRLAQRLLAYAGRPDVVVLGLPRGGVPVAFEVARALEVPLGVVVVRKLGVPGHKELAMGAIASGGIRVLNDDVVRHLNIPDRVIEAVTAQELRELHWRESAYRGDQPTPDVRGRAVILVDDGIATGSTMLAAIAALRTLEPARIIVAVPTAAPSTCDEIRRVADDCICEIMPEPFYAVGAWYEDFSQTTDEEVRDLLDQATTETTTAQRS